MLHSRLSQTSFENKACRLAKNGEKEKPGNKDVQIEHAIILSTIFFHKSSVLSVKFALKMSVH